MIRVGVCCKEEEMTSLWEEKITNYMKKEKLAYDMKDFSHKVLLFDAENKNCSLDILVLDLEDKNSSNTTSKNQELHSQNLHHQEIHERKVHSKLEQAASSDSDELKAGIIIGKKLSQISPSCLIIFCVENEEQIEEVFDTNCCFVIRRKYVEKYIDKAIRKAVDQVESKQKEAVLRIFSEGKLVYIQVKDILYIERVGRKLHVVTTETTYPCNMTLKELENEMGSSMARIHGGFIVNLKKVRKAYRHRVELENGSVIPVGKTFVKEFMEVWKAFV